MASLIIPDQTLEVCPLSVLQIRYEIEAAISSPVLPYHQGWTSIAENLSEGSDLSVLLSSPLFLTTALVSYRDRDPAVLQSSSLAESRRFLWEALLDPVREITYQSNGPDEMRRWLAWLATRLNIAAKQSFTLADLTYLDAERDLYLSRFRWIMGGVGGVAIGTVFAVVVGHWVGTEAGILMGLMMGLVTGVGGGSNLQDGVRRLFRMRLPERLRAARRAALSEWRGWASGLLVGAIVFACFSFWIVEPIEALVLGLAGGLVTGRVVGRRTGQDGLMRAGRLVYEVGSLVPLRPDNPRRVFVDSLRAGASVALLDGAGIGLVMGLAVGVRGGVAVGIVMGLAAGIAEGGDATIYYWLLTRRLARSGRFPRKPDRFLIWCTGAHESWIRRGTSDLPSQWLRQAGGVFQFRHRALQDHLAATATT